MLIDEYRRGWALRYLREAEDEIKMAKKDSRALDLVLDALRKAQTAIYYSLGEPYFIEHIVEETLERNLPIESPVLKCLVEIEKTINHLETLQQIYGDETIIGETDRIISVASKIVSLLTSIKD
ncbi:MAG: hypothetical protein QXK89_00830 [Candidatus Bathyarchaeia archaeon]